MGEQRTTRQCLRFQPILCLMQALTLALCHILTHRALNSNLLG